MENYTDTFKAVIILLLQSLIIREVVAYLGQKWIKSFLPMKIEMNYCLVEKKLMKS